MTQLFQPPICPAGEHIDPTTDGLHPDLLPYVDPPGHLARRVRHPFYWGPLLNARLNREASRWYLAARADAEMAATEGRWADHVRRHEEAFRLEALFRVADRMADRDLWRLLAENWTSYGPGKHWRSEVDALFASDRSGREAMMGDGERAFLASLPDPLTLYRGHQGANRRGHSWTLGYGIARWFSHRHRGSRPGVLRATAAKADVIAVLLGRRELEVVVVPERLEDVRPVRPLRRPAWATAVLAEATAAFRLARDVTDHGPRHWEAVERYVLALADHVAGADAKVARLFALLHDVGRAKEGDDPDHGRRAVDFAEDLYRQGKLGLSRRQMDALVAACAGHADGGVTADPTVGLCWDADRLDLMRLGIVPDPALLSTEAAKDRLFRI